MTTCNWRGTRTIGELLVKTMSPLVSIKDRELLDQTCKLYFRKDSVPRHLLVIEGINKNC